MTRGFSFTVPLTSRDIKGDSVCLHMFMKICESGSVCVCSEFILAFTCVQMHSLVSVCGGGVCKYCRIHIQQCDGALRLICIVYEVVLEFEN